MPQLTEDTSFASVLLVIVQKNGEKREVFSEFLHFYGEKWQKIKNQQSNTPFTLRKIWALTKTSKKLTSAVDAKGKKEKANKGGYLVQTCQVAR